MNFFANLHTHSSHSDGVYTPAELVRTAKKEGYKAIALTDHDTASGFYELKEECEKENIKYIFGAEFSVVEPNDYHIVGFDFDPEYPEMKKYLNDMAIRQTDNTKKCFDEAVQKGNIKGVTWEDILEYNSGICWLGNNHVFNAIKAKGLIKQFEYRDWFNKNFLHQRQNFAPIIRFKTLEEIIALIKKSGGFAVWAHPGEKIADIDFLVEMGIEGVEVWHPENSLAVRKKAIEYALEKGLFISGGSDHCGICGGYYSSYSSEEKLISSRHYIPELSCGTTKEYFDEMLLRRLNR